VGEFKLLGDASLKNEAWINTWALTSTKYLRVCLFCLWPIVTKCNVNVVPYAAMTGQAAARARRGRLCYL